MLTQTFVTSADSQSPYSFKYPADWKITTVGGITAQIANKDKSVTGALSYATFPVQDTPQAALADHLQNFKPTPEIKTFQLEDRDAARAEAIVGNKTQLFMFVNYKNVHNMALMVWAGSKASLAKEEPTILAIAAPLSAFASSAEVTWNSEANASRISAGRACAMADHNIICKITFLRGEPDPAMPGGQGYTKI